MTAKFMKALTWVEFHQDVQDMLSAKSKGIVMPGKVFWEQMDEEETFVLGIRDSTSVSVHSHFLYDAFLGFKGGPLTFSIPLEISISQTWGDILDEAAWLSMARDFNAFTALGKFTDTAGVRKQTGTFKDFLEFHEAVRLAMTKLVVMPNRERFFKAWQKVFQAQVRSGEEWDYIGSILDIEGLR